MDEQEEKTATGPVGRIVGKVKEVAGSVTGNERLEREGRIQRAQAAAEDEAREIEKQAAHARQQAELEEERHATEHERERIAADLAAASREAAIERDREQAERRAAEIEQQKKQDALRIQQANRAAAEKLEVDAAVQYSEETAEAARLEKAAEHRESVAEELDNGER